MNSLDWNPKITCSALLPSVCQTHEATGVLLVLGTNTTSNLNSYTHTTVKTTQEPVVWRGAVRPGMGGG
jgi:L-asparaginase/Glu-tRNA(Gln) amidotransferase subunit D